MKRDINPIFAKGLHAGYLAPFLGHCPQSANLCIDRPNPIFDCGYIIMNKCLKLNAEMIRN